MAQIKFDSINNLFRSKYSIYSIYNYCHSEVLGVYLLNHIHHYLNVLMKH